MNNTTQTLFKQMANTGSALVITKTEFKCAGELNRMGLIDVRPLNGIDGYEITLKNHTFIQPVIKLSR